MWEKDIKQNLMLQIYNVFMLDIHNIDAISTLKYDWPPFGPLYGAPGGHNDKIGQNCIFSGSLHWSNGGWKSL